MLPAAFTLQAISAWFGTLFGRATIVGICVASWFGWLHLHDVKIENRTIERGHQAGRELNAKGLKAREKVRDVDDPAAQLLRQSCRDC